MLLDQEYVINRTKNALNQCNITSLYDTFNLILPSRMKVAEYLIFQFEHLNFNFDVTLDEERLQDKYEEMQEYEVSHSGAGEAGDKWANRNENIRLEVALARRRKKE